MDETIVATYCLCVDLLDAIGHQEDRQCQMTDAQIMTTAITAARRISNGSFHLGFPIFSNIIASG